MTSPSLLSAVRDILDQIGPDDSFFPTEIHSFSLPGPATSESIALEHSLRNLISRFQKLEQPSIHTSLVNNRRVPKKLQDGRDTDDKPDKEHVCSSCGHPLDSIPSTPEEVPPSYSNAPHGAKRVATSSLMLKSYADSGPETNGYESSSSDITTISTPSTSSAIDSIV
jgi:hypothetical protein